MGQIENINTVHLGASSELEECLPQRHTPPEKEIGIHWRYVLPLGTSGDTRHACVRKMRMQSYVCLAKLENTYPAAAAGVAALPPTPAHALGLFLENA